MPKPGKLIWARSHCIFSPCRQWRYTLERWWGEGPYVNFLCLNPSTADEEHNDPTVTRCCHYARRWGYAGCVVTNIFGLRSTDPHNLLLAQDPVGIDNDEWIFKIAHGAAMVIAAWGVWGKVNDRGRTLAHHLTRTDVPLYCLGITKEGFPRHPLYLPAAAQPLVYDYASVTGKPDPLSRRRTECLQEILELKNCDLLDEALRLAGGDDYDGCFTPFGQWKYDMLTAELRRRLRDWLIAPNQQCVLWGA